MIVEFEAFKRCRNGKNYDEVGSHDKGSKPNRAYFLRKILDFVENRLHKILRQALVPFESPINQSGLLFYNTLFDENATCHLALGMGYSDSICGYEDMSYDELTELGVNRSMVHVDFMIGTPDFSVDAVSEDGSVHPLFRNGTWAI